MFGRKRHAAPAPVVPPRLSEDQLFDLVHTHLSAVLGEHGDWTLSRRKTGDTDVLFHGVAARALAAQITAVIQTEQHRLEARPDAVAHESTHVAEPEPAVTETREPAEWMPAPITQWADLRRPVTGEIPQVAEAAREERQPSAA